MSKVERDEIAAEARRAMPAIKAAQEQLYSADPQHKFAQLLKSDNPKAKPPHRQHLPSWDDLDVAGIWGYGKDKMKGVWWCDEYDSPDGRGFIFSGLFTDESGTWHLSLQEGPGTEFEHDWSLVRFGT